MAPVRPSTCLKPATSQTRHLGRLAGFTWSELEDFSADQVNPVKAFDLRHSALPTGAIQIDARDMDEDDREELRDAFRQLES